MRGSVWSRPHYTAPVLQSVRVLVVEDDPDLCFLTEHLLRTYGAEVRAVMTGEEAVDVAREWSPHVLIADLVLPGIDGIEVLRQIRSNHPTKVAAIAVSGAARDHDRSRSLAAGFEKHLIKPAASSEIAGAVATLMSMGGNPDGLKTVLARLNASGSCQYTSLLRFGEAGELISMWTHDRKTPAADTFDLGVEISASYCVLVKQTGSVTVIENARIDPRVASHPKRDAVAAYLGVPVFDPSGSMFGTLCSYDVEPRTFTQRERQEHEEAASELSSLVARWSTKP